MCPIIRRVPEFVEGKTFIIENVLVDHCSVFQPNTNYRPEWCVVIRVPQAMIQQFYEVGFRLKQDSEGRVTLRARRWVRLDDGTEMKPPQVVDADGNPWDPNSRGLIGNGSRCNVKVKAKYTTYQGVEGLGCFLEGLQVCDLVPYSGSGPAFGKADGNTAGFSQGNFVPQAPPPQQYPGMPQPPQQYDPNPFANRNPNAPLPGQSAPPVGYAPPVGGFGQPVAPAAPASPGGFVPPAAAGATGGFAPPINPAVPQYMQPGFPGAFSQQAGPAPDEGKDYNPGNAFPNTGDDVPF